MQYRSTRGHGPVGFGEVLTGGVAPDGGLYLPEAVARAVRDLRDVFGDLVSADWFRIPVTEAVATIAEAGAGRVLSA